MNIEQNSINYEISEEYWHLVQGGTTHPGAPILEIPSTIIGISALVEDAEKPGSNAC